MLKASDIVSISEAFNSNNYEISNKIFFFDKQSSIYPQQSYYKIKNGKALTEKEFEKISIEITKNEFLKIVFLKQILKRIRLLKSLK
jgi:predicted transglutaminase-like protease